MCRFPTKVVEDKIYRDPTEEEYLVDIVLEESAIVVFGAAACELSAGGIREEAPYAPGNWHVNLYHGTLRSGQLFGPTGRKSTTFAGRREAAEKAIEPMTETNYRWVFLLGALWNLLGGAFIIAATGWIFNSAGLAVPFPAAYYYTWTAMILIFGLGYYCVYRDMFRNRDIVLMGVIGKTAFSAVFLYHFISYPGQIPDFFLIPIVGDLVFVVLFVMFLRFARETRSRDT
jgi:hypothetical protein